MMLTNSELANANWFKLMTDRIRLHFNQIKRSFLGHLFMRVINTGLNFSQVIYLKRSLFCQTDPLFALSLAHKSELSGTFQIVHREELSTRLALRLCFFFAMLTIFIVIRFTILAVLRKISLKFHHFDHVDLFQYVCATSCSKHLSSILLLII